MTKHTLIKLEESDSFHDIMLISTHLLWLYFLCNLLSALATHLGWPSGIGLGPGSVLLLEVSGSILSGVNLGGLI
jgi:hypothetical protein